MFLKSFEAANFSSNCTAAILWKASVRLLKEIFINVGCMKDKNSISEL